MFQVGESLSNSFTISTKESSQINAIHSTKLLLCDTIASKDRKEFLFV